MEAMTDEKQGNVLAATERHKPGPKPKPKSNPEQSPVIDEGKTLNITDIEDQFVVGGDKQAAKKAKDPFAGYVTTRVVARRYPRNPQLDLMSRDELLKYCIANNFFKKGWIQERGKTPDTYEMIVVKVIKTQDSQEEILKYIDKRESVTFPAHWLVFTTLTNPTPGYAHSRGIVSWYSKRFESVAFEMQWPLPTPDDPYRAAKLKNVATIVPDDSVRAQLLFMNEAITGKVIRRMNGSTNAYYLLPSEDRSLPILEKLYFNGTKGSDEYAALRQWEKEFGLPEVGS